MCDRDLKSTYTESSEVSIAESADILLGLLRRSLDLIPTCVSINTLYRECSRPYFHAMFIGASTKDSFPAFQSMKPFQHVRKNNGIKVSHMGIYIEVSVALYCMISLGYFACIHIKNWCRDIVWLLSWRGIGKVTM